MKKTIKVHVEYIKSVPNNLENICIFALLIKDLVQSIIIRKKTP